MASYFLKYARNTPFYEVIIQDMVPALRNDADVTEFLKRCAFLMQASAH